MKTNETSNNEFSQIEASEIDRAELESIVAALPLRTGLQAGLIPCL